jgi:NAD(P)-dependent dehydrogenase (short-subunit alcohol dehydrogenase family)
MAKNVLIIGGTSGLGFSLASLFVEQGRVVHVTGRSNPGRNDIRYTELALDNEDLIENLDNLVEDLPYIDIFVYAAGFYQEGHICEFTDADILKMERVGLTAPMLLMSRLLRKQGTLSKFVAITSTSQWTPRELEPVYTATKAGLGMFANSMSHDPSVDQVLVIGVAGMNTPFWREVDRDTSDMLSPDWVATQVALYLAEEFRYRFVKILRSPPRVEIAEER